MGVRCRSIPSLKTALAKLMKPYLINKTQSRRAAAMVVQVVEHLPSMRETLNSVSRMAKIKNKCKMKQNKILPIRQFGRIESNF
jgi:hypothetical protein